MISESRPVQKNPATSPTGHSPITDGAAAKITGRTFQVLEFLLGKEHFAIDLFDVREVVEYTSITKLPNAASCMKGIIDLRGEITTIIDLKERLHIRTGAACKEGDGRFIVLDEKLTGIKTGILVDDVLAVSTFEKSDVDSASASGGREDAAILGIIKKKVRVKEQERHDLVIWIDIRHLLSNIGEE